MQIKHKNPAYRITVILSKCEEKKQQNHCSLQLQCSSTLHKHTHRHTHTHKHGYCNLLTKLAKGHGWKLTLSHKHITSKFLWKLYGPPHQTIKNLLIYCNIYIPSNRHAICHKLCTSMISEYFFTQRTHKSWQTSISDKAG